MIPCNIVELKTAKGYFLYGFWYGPKTAKRTVIIVHGLTSSAFGDIEMELASLLADKNTAVFLFNNRGYGIVNKIYRDAPRTKKGYTAKLAGAAHEVFEDSIDDIEAAVAFARKSGAKKIFLAGHSTGCQKSAYWASRKKSRGVRGIILIAPISDYAAELKLQGKHKLQKAVSIARSLVKRGKKHSLLPENVWHETLDGQRFLSLYTPDSPEEIFPYAQPHKSPRSLRSIRIPVLVLLAEKDQFADRPATEIAKWFDRHLLKNAGSMVVPGVRHSFKGAEKRVVNEIMKFMKET